MYIPFDYIFTFKPSLEQYCILKIMRSKQVQYTNWRQAIILLFYSYFFYYFILFIESYFQRIWLGVEVCVTHGGLEFYVCVGMYEACRTKKGYIL